jgi:hypothetical protein
MSKSLAAFAMCVVTSAVTTFAQQPTARTPIAPGPVNVPGQADMMKLQMTMMEAQQKAIKPGDEALPCEALQKELVSTMNDPAIQAYAAKTNAAYAKEAEAIQKKGMTPDAAAALAASLVPGAGMAGMPPMPQVTPGQPITPQQMQQAMVAQQQASIAYMNQLAPIMPAIMRSQRVSMLALTKNCAWVTGGLGLYPGAGAPTAISPGAVVPRQK